MLSVHNQAARVISPLFVSWQEKFVPGLSASNSTDTLEVVVTAGGPLRICRRKPNTSFHLKKAIFLCSQVNTPRATCALDVLTAASAYCILSVLRSLTQWLGCKTSLTLV